jgi:hypothetical protein
MTNGTKLAPSATTVAVERAPVWVRSQRNDREVSVTSTQYAIFVHVLYPVTSTQYTIFVHVLYPVSVHVVTYKLYH